MNHTSRHRRRILIALVAVAGTAMLGSAGGASATSVPSAQSGQRCVISNGAVPNCLENSAWRTN